MALQSNLKDLGILLSALKDDHLSRAEFTEAFKAVVDAVQKTRQELLNANEQLSSSAIKRIEDRLESALSEVQKVSKEIDSKFESFQKEMKSDARTTLRLLTDELAKLRTDMPPPFDGSDIVRELGELRNSIPEVPEQFDPSDISEKIESLQADIQELKERPLGRSGGGHTDAGVKHSLGRLIKTETPSGTIDGANTAFTTTQPIFAVVSYMLNGEVVGSGNYTIAGNTITWTTAPPAAYSGKDHEIIYV